MRDSARATAARFDSPEAAAKYAGSLGGTATHRREERCVCRSLRKLPAESRVLDLPCGAGRFFPLLLDMGFRVTAADTSPHMLEQARRELETLHHPADRVDFSVADALSSGFDDDAFDGVLCNRLLHHFRESQTRRAALVELRRICRGPIVVSFFCNWSWDAAVFHLKNALARRKAIDRVPIGYRTICREAESAGLRVRSVAATRPGISKQWYLELQANA